MCLRSWKRIRRRPESSRNERNALLKFDGSSCVPVVDVKRFSLFGSSARTAASWRDMSTIRVFPLLGALIFPRENVRLFAPRELKMWRGRSVVTAKHCKDLSPGEFAEFLDRIIAEAGDMGIVIHRPIRRNRRGDWTHQQKTKAFRARVCHQG